MIRILGVVGSPRIGGNTELFVNEALKAAEGEGAKVELVRLAD
ncbi:MAG: NAD(P)H-dependent oxidoreductase, partial [Nitrososphaeria archaeon]